MNYEQEIIAFMDFAKLTLKEQQVIFFRYGINCECKTLKSVGEVFSVSGSRIRQIQMKAERKMRRGFKRWENEKETS